MSKIIIIVGLGFLLLAGFGYSAWKAYVPHEVIHLDQKDRVETCERALQDSLNRRLISQGAGTAQGTTSSGSAMNAAVAQELDVISKIASHCYDEVNEVDTLSEAAIRRSAFLNQQSALPVLMWMVIAITLSGVGLACLQLWASYELAVQGKGALEQRSDISLEMSKVSTSTSVSGISVLLISLAFFYIFVKEIYLIRSTTLEGVPLGATSLGTPSQLLPGGTGQPPPSPPNEVPDAKKREPGR